MSMINITVDTINQTVDASLDGMPLNNVTSIVLFTKKSGMFGAEISSAEEISDGVNEFTTILANKKTEGKFIKKEIVDTNKTSEDIMKYIYGDDNADI